MLYLHLQVSLHDDNLCIDVRVGAPSNIVVKDASGNVITSFSTVLYTYIEKITLSCSETNVQWTITPSLPKSLTLDRSRGIISGQVTELLARTEFNITATSSSGSVSTSFPITITSCSHGKFLFPRVESSDQGMLILKKGGEEIYKAYLSTSGIVNAICIPYSEYDYSFNCMGASNGFCNVIIEDDDYNVYLSLKVQKGVESTGKMNMVASGVPTPVVESNPFLVVSGENSLLFFSATGVHGNFTFTPALPEGIEFHHGRSSLKGAWNVRGIHTFTVQCRNEKGVGSLVFSVAVDRCLENLHLAQLSRNQGKPDELFNVTNSQGEMVYATVFTGNAFKVNLCLPDDEYMFHMYKEDGSGWSSKAPLMVYDETGYNTGIYTIESGYENNMAFSLIHAVPAQSSLRYTKGNVNSKWFQTSFKDGSWSEGSQGKWGQFDSQKVYFRKHFTLSETRVYAHLIVDVQAKDRITVYVNGEKRFETDKTASNDFTRFSLPSSAMVQGENVIAIMLERTKSQSSSAIEFDLRVQPLFSSCLSYVNTGSAADDLKNPDVQHLAVKAFDDDPLTYWVGTALPATLTYTFSNSRYEMINKVMMYKATESRDLPLAFTIYGINGNEKVVLKEVRSSTLFQGSGYATVQFSNTRAFNQYAFMFTSSQSGTRVQVNEIALYSCNELSCKKKMGYSAIPTGEAHYKDCPLGSVGTRQMKCVDVNNQPEWVDDRSSCLAKTPSTGVAYVDTSFILYNVTFSTWELSVKKGITDIITANLVVKANETAYTFIRDMTDDSICKIFFSLRFTLEEDIGDYVKRHTDYLVNDFNEILKKRFSLTCKGISIELQDGPTLHEPIHWSTIILNTILICIIVVLLMVLYLRSGKKTAGKKSLTSFRAKNKEEGKHSLLEESLPVCSPHNNGTSYIRYPLTLGTTLQ